MKYALVDLANNFFRCRHIASRSRDPSEKVGMALHLIFTGINSMVNKFGIDHVVFCLEGRSWRKDFYKPYKANRVVDETALTQAERDEEQLFWDTYADLTTHLRERTNCSVLRAPNGEADDLIGRWIALHPQDQHVVISSDGDFYQLVTDKVSLYNTLHGVYITTQSIVDDRGRKLAFTVDNNSKIKLGKPDPHFTPAPDWIEYSLFLKCMRGDKGDNVFSAYPGVRTVGSKNKVGLLEAYQDRQRQGFNWNNLMLQRWIDHNDVEHVVRDVYERNRILIDLTCQPPEIKDQIDGSIRDSLRVDTVGQVGVHFMRFCGKHQLVKLGEQANYYSAWLNRGYNGHLKEKPNED